MQALPGIVICKPSDPIEGTMLRCLKSDELDKFKSRRNHEIVLDDHDGNVSSFVQFPPVCPRLPSWRTLLDVVPMNCRVKRNRVKCRVVPHKRVGKNVIIGVSLSTFLSMNVNCV